ncbi:hypothetical protein PTKIN_Ptkin09bG0276300 [Pterospermum kingtungense]
MEGEGYKMKEVAAVQGAAGQVIAPCIQAEEGTYNWLKRKYRYVKRINQNFDRLELADRRLRDARKSVQNKLENRSKREVTPECETWLSQVKKMRDEIATLRHGYQNRPSTCLCRLCPLRASLNLSKLAVKKTKEADDLRNELRDERFTLMVDKPPSTVHRSHRWKNDVGIVDHPSRRNQAETLIGWLKEERLKRICIWGPPGVGKTTIMKTVHDNLCKSDQFDYSFFITLTEESRILEDIQEEIWKRLGLRMDENNDRSTVISERLSTMRYVLFLDTDFFSDLKQVEQVKQVCNNYDHKHGKVVFACRDKYDDHTDEDMNVKKLSKEDARKLFWELVGLDLEKKHEIKENGQKIIDLCGGMPHMLSLIGKRLVEKKSVRHWRVVKSKLQSPSEEEWKEWEEYYKSFKLVYEELPADYKPCSLYWAILPFDEEINGEYIIDCLIAETLLEDDDLCLARDIGHVMLDRFTDKYILEKGETLGHFKMFLCFQWAALRIANEEDEQYFVGNGKKVENEEWLKAKRVSLARISSMYRIPEMPKCAGMLTLSLHEYEVTEFPKQFFKSMNGLQVLCIWKSNKINALPSSISSLSKLRGLFLDNCSMLVQLPKEIAELKSLEILVVRQTRIYSLPMEIGELRNLKCLRVSTGTQDGIEERMIPIIPSGIIKNLSKLEELSIDVDPNIRSWIENADEIAKEITELTKLTHLHFYFPHIEIFGHFVLNSRSRNVNGETREFKGFRSFNMFVGEQGNSSASDFNALVCSSVKHLKFSARHGFPEAEVSKILKQTKSFELVGHKTARSLTDKLPADTLQELEACIVEECDAMQSIVDGNENITGGVVFQCLEKLHIKNLRTLVSIWNGTIPFESFRALTTLTLKECESIKMVFSLEMVQQLSELQNLQVEDCAKIEKIIGTNVGSTVDESLVLPRLKNFQLCGLTSLSRICDASVQWPSLEILEIKTGGALRGLPCMVENAPKLRKIQCAEDWWHEQWSNNKTEEWQYQKYYPYPPMRRKSGEKSASHNQARLSSSMVAVIGLNKKVIGMFFFFVCLFSLFWMMICMN